MQQLYIYTFRHIWLAAFLLWLPAMSQADEIRPAYLQITEIDNTVYDVFWKVPALGETQRLALYVEFSDDVKTLSQGFEGFVDNAHIQRWTISHPDHLIGTTLSIEGLDKSSTEVLLRIENLDGTSTLHRLTPDAPAYTVSPQPGLAQVISTYLLLGIEHILMGVDHLLFVLVLLILVEGTRKLVWTITAFTVAHSITLSLASLQIISIPVPPVEACIALSIMFVATEIIHGLQGRPGLTAQRPWLVAFTFGLLHGLGFAAALGQIGLPQTDVPAALLFFNVGVEIGQLIFVGGVLSAVWTIKRIGFNIPQWATRAATYVIGSVAAFWVIERTAGFWV